VADDSLAFSGRVRRVRLAINGIETMLCTRESAAGCLTYARVAAFAAVALLLPVLAVAQGPGKPSACEQEALKRYGSNYAVGRSAKNLRAPKKIHDVRPTYPAVPQGSTVKLDGWLVEALIAPTGNVTDVWILREVRFTPPFPEFTQAAVAAIRMWRFEPVELNGKPTPVCMKVSGNINWP